MTLAHDEYSLLPEYLRDKYEREIGEPWSELESRVRARRPEFFAMWIDGDKHDSE